MKTRIEQFEFDENFKKISTVVGTYATKHEAIHIKKLLEEKNPFNNYELCTNFQETEIKFKELPTGHFSTWSRQRDSNESICNTSSEGRPSIIGVDYFTSEGKRSNITFQREYVIGGFYFEHAIYEATKNPKYPCVY